MAFTVQWIVDNFVYVGGIKNTSSPKTKKFWKEETNGTVVLDPETQVKALNDIYVTVQEAKKNNQEIVVVCQKSGLSDVIAGLAQKHGFHYLTNKLPAGFLTNFDTLFSTIKQMNEKKKFIASESFAKLTKKEQSMNKRHLAKIEKIYEGVKNLTRKPELVIVVDAAMFDGLVHEIEVSNTPSILLASTDFPKRWDRGNIAVLNMHNQKSPTYVLETLFA